MQFDTEKMREEYKKKESSLLITPRLQFFVRDFQEFHHVNRGYPLLIHGPRGAGKSLFIYILAELHRQYKGSGKVFSLDCRMFKENQLQSKFLQTVTEIITQKKREGRKDRLTQESNGGILLFENWETLSDPHKTRLLSCYQKQGQPHQFIQLAATTNDVKTSIDEGSRFRTFYVPPIHERREDILYFLHWECPTLIENLFPVHILTLLAYNWPGNIPELKEVGKSLKFSSGSSEISFNKCFSYNDITVDIDISLLGECFTKLEKMVPLLDIHQATRLYDELKQKGVNADLLEMILRRFHLGMCLKPFTCAMGELFSDKEYWNAPEVEWTTIFGQGPDGKEQSVRVQPPILTLDISQFSHAYTGLRMFSSLFFQNPLSNKHLLNVEAGSLLNYAKMLNGTTNDEMTREAGYGLMESVLSKYRGLDLPGPIPREGLRDGFFVFMKSLLQSNPSSQFVSSLLKGEDATDPPETWKNTTKKTFDQLTYIPPPYPPFFRIFSDRKRTPKLDYPDERSKENKYEDKEDIERAIDVDDEVKEPSLTPIVPSLTVVTDPKREHPDPIPEDAAGQTSRKSSQSLGTRYSPPFQLDYSTPRILDAEKKVISLKDNPDIWEFFKRMFCHSSDPDGIDFGFISDDEIITIAKVFGYFKEGADNSANFRNRIRLFFKEHMIDYKTLMKRNRNEGYKRGPYWDPKKPIINHSQVYTGPLSDETAKKLTSNETDKNHSSDETDKKLT